MLYQDLQTSQYRHQLTFNLPDRPVSAMSSYNSTQSSTGSKADYDTCSISSTSTTSSTTQLLKSKLLPKSKESSSLKPIDERGPGEKQAERQQGRMNMQTLGTLAALK